MRSVYTKTLLSSLIVLAFSFLIFILIVRTNAFKAFKAGGSLGGLLDEQSLQAETQYTHGGRDALSAYLQDVAHHYPGTRRVLLDANGSDVITGASYAKQLAECESMLSRFNLFGPIFIRQDTPDGKYILLFEPSPTSRVSNFVYYYFLLILAIAVLCLAFRHQFVLPLNQLTDVVGRLGTGDLSARIGSRRKDELGKLGRTIDEMAQRIQTLLSAERRLLQDISHELRSPLARLSFAVELARSSSDPETAFARVNKEIDRLTELIQSLIEVTRAEGDPAVRNNDTVDVNELLNEILEDNDIEARQRGCWLSLKRSQQLRLPADRELLRRAIENIVRNAIHHAPNGSAVEVEVNNSDSGVLISICDRGTGVPEEHLQAIFRPFYRIDDSRTEKTGGIGLGLAIAERAIRVHNGNVWAENGHPGLHVYIELPSSPVMARADLSRGGDHR